MLPDTLLNIGIGAFEDCENLKEITLPDSLKNIGNGAFNDCNIQTIEIPDNIEHVDEHIFELSCSTHIVYKGKTYECSEFRKFMIEIGLTPTPPEEAFSIISR